MACGVMAVAVMACKVLAYSHDLRSYGRAACMLVRRSIFPPLLKDHALPCMLWTESELGLDHEQRACHHPLCTYRAPDVATRVLGVSCASSYAPRRHILPTQLLSLELRRTDILYMVCAA